MVFWSPRFKLTNEQHNIYRKISQESRETKRRAEPNFEFNIAISYVIAR